MYVLFIDRGAVMFDHIINIVIYISSAQLKKKGIECIYDNVKVASSVHLLFLCVLPSQMATVADDIRTIIPPHCTVYTFLSSVPIPRLRRMLNAQAIIRPEFTWERFGGGGGEEAMWDCSKDVCITLENQEQVEMTCPLAEMNSESAISINTILHG